MKKSTKIFVIVSGLGFYLRSVRYEAGCYSLNHTVWWDMNEFADCVQYTRGDPKITGTDLLRMRAF
jgi:hypothetical protein